METSSAKVLDETCNCNNDAYRDEALYAAWAAMPRDAANDATLAALPAGQRVDVNAFMARLRACQE